MTPIKQPILSRPETVSVGDRIYLIEDIFFKDGSRGVHAGERHLLVEMIQPGMEGYMKVKVLKSKGVNFLPSGVVIERPFMNILKGVKVEADWFPSLLKSGGHLEGTDAAGNKVKMDDTSKGGISKGSSHENGGIKGAVGTEERPIEFEGEEIILTAPLSSNPQEYEFNGNKLNARQIASKLNQDNGGVSFDDGGEVKSCRCSGKKYNFSGKQMSDYAIINMINH